MSWKDLFKSKTSKGRPDPRLRWFGKLPTYADYYSSATDEDWAVEFNEWVLKGYELYLARQRDGRASRRLPSAAAVLRLPTSQMTVLASIQDYGGDMRGRPFPLCFYIGLPTALWPGPASDHAVAAVRLLGKLTALRDRVIRFFNAPGRFDAVFGDQEFDLSDLGDETGDDSWTQAAGKLSFADWFGAAKSCLKLDDADTWYQRASTWGASISKLESEQFGPTLRFPLVMNLPSEPQIAGWLRWLERRIDVQKRYLSLVVSHEPAAATGHLTIIARDLMPDDFLLLTPAAATLPFVDDLCGIGAAIAGPQGAAQSGGEGASVRAPEKWSDFVEAAIPT